MNTAARVKRTISLQIPFQEKRPVIHFSVVISMGDVMSNTVTMAIQ